MSSILGLNFTLLIGIGINENIGNFANRQYLASCLRYPAHVLLRRTSDTLRTSVIRHFARRNSNRNEGIQIKQYEHSKS